MRAIAAILCLTAPAIAFAQQGQPQSPKQAAPAAQTNASGQGSQQGQRPQVAQQCLDRLQRVDQQLVETGYGMAGPTGYWSPYGAYGTAAAPATSPAAPGAGYGTLSPRGEMRSLMNAGYILAMNGYGDACGSVVSAVQDIQERFQTASASGDRDATRAWRERYLTSSVPVTEAKAPVAIDQIVGADIRNMRDEDLGDIEDVVLGQNGNITHVLVGRGGFLGIGEQLVPVRWKDLRMTAAPYQDTFVLNVSENAFDDAPAVDANAARQLAQGDLSKQVDQFWNQRLAQGGTQGQGTAGSSGGKPAGSGSGQSQ